MSRKGIFPLWQDQMVWIYCQYCSAWPRLKLNTKIGLHTTHHHPPPPPPHKLLGSNISAVTGLTTFKAEHFRIQSCHYTYLAKVNGSTRKHWFDSSPDPVVHFEAPGGHFVFSRRCIVASSERMPHLRLGRYFIIKGSIFPP